MVGGCDQSATRGEAWTNANLRDIEQYQKGIRLGLAVQDIAVRLALCDDHSRELTAAAWSQVLAKLTTWELPWTPSTSTDSL